MNRRSRGARFWAALTTAVMAFTAAPVVIGDEALPASEAYATTELVAGAEDNELHIYLRAGETLKVSGKPKGSTGVAITLTPPNGKPVVVPSTGVVQSYTATVEGIWLMTFVGTNPDPVSNDLYDWSIHVLDGATEKPGRFWSYAYRRYDGIAEAFTYWMVNDLGYIYRASHSNYRGVISLLQANSVGVADAECTPMYRSTELTGDIYGQTLPVMDECGQQYRVFLEEPDSSMPASSMSARGMEHILPSPLSASELEVSPMVFTPSSSATVGTFSYTIDSRFTGGYLFQIDANGNGSYSDAVDRSVQLGADGSGSYEYQFDGLDGAGKPIGTTVLPSARLYFDKIGEMHVIQVDVESRAGIEITRLNGPSSPNKSIYWNDSGLTTVGKSTVTPVMNASQTAVTSSATTHGWDVSGADPWGNNRIIDDWTYIPASVGSTQLTFGGQVPTVSKASDLPPSARAGDTGTYTVTMKNTGPGEFSAEVPAVLHDDLSAALDDVDVTWSGITATIDGRDVSSGLATTSSGLTWSGALASGASVVVTIPITVKAGGDGTVRNVSWVTTPWTSVTGVPSCTSTAVPVACVTDLLPRVAVTKTADTTDLPAVGQRVHYTVTLTNNGPGTVTAARPVELSDDLAGVLDDADLDAASVTASSGTPTVTDGVLSWSGALASGASVTLGYDVIYRGGSDNTLINTACISTELAAGGSACDTSTVPGTSVSTLALTKSAELRDADGNGTADLGESIGYSFSVVNTGNTTLTGLVVDDPLLTAAGLTTVCATDTLAPGQSTTCAVSGDLVVTEADLVAGGVLNTAIARALGPEGEPIEDQDGTTTPTTAVSRVLDLTKTGVLDDVVLTNGTADVGESVNYGFELRNSGNVTLSDIRVDDPLLTGAGITITCLRDGTPITSLAPGESMSCVASAAHPVTQVVLDQLNGAMLSNTAQAFALDPTGTTVPSEKSTVDIPVTPADPVLEFVKDGVLDDAVIVNGTADVGERVTYSFTVRNAGNVTLTDLRVEDPMLADAGVTITGCTRDGVAVTSLDPGDTALCTTDQALLITQDHVDQLAGALLSNTAQAFAVDPGGESVPSEKSTVDIPITGTAPGLALTKTEGSWTDVNDNGLVDAGDTQTYVFQVSNVGNVTMTDVRVDDPMLTERGVDLSGCALGTLPVGGAAVTCESGPMTLTELDITAGILLNVAGATGQTPGGEQVEAPEAEHELPLPDIHFTKTVSADASPVVAGSTLTYTLTLTNYGQADGVVSREDIWADVLDDATLTSQPTVAPVDSGVTVSGTSDNGFLLGGTLAAGATATVTYTVQVLPDAEREAGSRALNFLIEPGGQPSDSCDPGDLTCTDTGLPVLRTSKTVDPASGSSVQPGQTLTYTLTFENEGTSPAPVDLVDDLTHVVGDDAQWVTGSERVSAPEALTVGFTSPHLRITGSVAAGQTVTVAYQVTVNPSAAQGDHQLTNYVLAPGETTPGPNECTPERICTVNLAGDLAVAKSSQASSTPLIEGGTVDYTLTFTNSGIGAVDVDHVDDLAAVLDDADLDVDSLVVPDGLTVVRDGDRLLVSGQVAAGATSSVTYRVVVQADASRQGDDLLINHLLTADQTSPGAVCETTATSTCVPVSQVEYAKSVTSAPEGPVVAGSVLTYAITVTNVGQGEGVVSREDVLGDVLDDAVVIAEPTVMPADAGVSVSPVTDGRIQITGVLGAGRSVMITYQVQVLPDAQRASGSQAVNWLVEPGTGPEGACTDDSPHCTVTDLPVLDVSKTSTPEPGSDLEVGAEVEYTITFRNAGTGTAPVDYVDDLTHVLDDATLTVSSLGSTDPDQVAVDYPEPRIALTGAVRPGESVSVSYTVTVRPDGQQGDHVLTNYVLRPTDPVPDECEPGLVCVTHFSGDLAFTKSATPSATPLLAGETVDYELTFINSGIAPVTVAHVDYLAHVIDDAEVGEATVSDHLSVTPAGDRFLIGGSLPAHSTATVRYTATVRPDGERGDDLVVNHLIAQPTDETELPEPPDPERPCSSTATATCHEVGQVVYTKTVSADPATLVDGQIVAGTRLNYLVTAQNIGRGDADVFRTDDMSDVLDDTDLISAPSSDNPTAVQVSEVTDQAFTLTGMLGTGQIARVTYQVEVRAELDRTEGNSSAANFLLADGERLCTDDADDCVPTVCEPGSGWCTETALPYLGYQKTVEVDPSAPIIPGSALRYTVTVTNTGGATGVVSREDDLTDVLDDADLVADPVSDTDSVTVTPTQNGRFALGGTLAAGATARITYTLTVKADLDRLDTNALAQPLPLLDYEKTVTSADDVLVAGSVLDYTITVTNSGNATGQVLREDDLSGVLDEAVIVGGPESDTASVLVTEVDPATGRFALNGTLDAGVTATIRYSVQLLPDADRVASDDVAANYVVWPGQPGGPESCGPDTPCTSTPVPSMTYTKAVSADTDPVGTGTVLTYTITASNIGTGLGVVDRADVLGGVLDDADILTEPVLTSGPETVTVSPVVDGRFSIGGTLPAGESATVSYQVQVRDESARVSGDRVALNLLVPNAVTEECTDAGDVDCIPTECLPGGECTSTPLPFIEVVKQADPESGESVQAGQDVTYTVRFTNSGQTAGTVERVDDLRHVLDDADLDAASILVDHPDWSAEFDGESRIVLLGMIEPGQEVTLTYRVTVRPDGQQGDHVLANYVLAPSEEVPTEPECGPDQVCTSNPVGDITVTKTADPDSGSEVLVNDVVRYELTFSNVGQGTAGLAHRDDLSQVLDDADLTELPTASGSSVTVSDGRDGEVRIGGELAAGETVTVRYAVTVRAADQRGDSILGNVVLRDGQQRPAECTDDSTVPCTTHPVGDDPYRSGVLAAGNLAITGATVGAALLLALLLTGLGIVFVRGRRSSGRRALRG